jgi:hypothetical protein
MVYRATDQLYGSGKLEIKFRLFHTGIDVAFPATLTSFTDTFTPTWNTEIAYGRTDPIATYSNTQRVISFSWQTAAGEPAEANRYISDVNKLYSGLYPIYDGDFISQAPIIGVRIGSFLHDGGGGDFLTGFFQSVSAEPDFDAGVFLNGDTFAPKIINFSVTMQVIHQQTMDARGFSGFPYNPPNAQGGGCTLSQTSAQPPSPAVTAAAGQTQLNSSPTAGSPTAQGGENATPGPEPGSPAVAGARARTGSITTGPGFGQSSGSGRQASASLRRGGRSQADFDRDLKEDARRKADALARSVQAADPGYVPLNPPLATNPVVQEVADRLTQGGPSGPRES